MKLRTLPTVIEGIKHWPPEPLSQGLPGYLEYSPGNGQTYRLILVAPSREMCSRLRMDHPAMVVTWIRPMRHHSFVVPDSVVHLAWEFVQRQGGCDRDDAIVLAELFGFLTGRSHTTCEQAREAVANLKDS